MDSHICECSLCDRYQSESASFRKALEEIAKHTEYTAGGFKGVSTTYRIATTALEGGEDE